MLVKVNGKEEVIEETTLDDLLRSKKVEPQMVTVELNGRMINRKHLTSTPLHEGDEIEFLYFMGGGSDNRL